MDKTRVRIWRQLPGTGDVQPHTAREKMLAQQYEKQIENLAQTINDLSAERKSLKDELKSKSDEAFSYKSEIQRLEESLEEVGLDVDRLEENAREAEACGSARVMEQIAHAFVDYEYLLDDLYNDYYAYNFTADDIRKYLQGAYHVKIRPDGFRDIFEFREAARRGVENVREFDPLAIGDV